jgi:hypothetical protein
MRFFSEKAILTLINMRKFLFKKILGQCLRWEFERVKILRGEPERTLKRYDLNLLEFIPRIDQIRPCSRSHRENPR